MAAPRANRLPSPSSCPLAERPGWTDATEVAPGRIDLTITAGDGSERVVSIRMTADEWENIAAVAWGDFDLAAEQVKRWVLELQDDEHFLLYGDYRLYSSVTPEWPVDPELERLRALARQHPEGIGRWVTTDADGNIVDEFRQRDD